MNVMTNIDRIKFAAQIAGAVRELAPADMEEDELAVVMLLAMQGLVGMRATATICSQIGPKLG